MGIKNHTYLSEYFVHKYVAVVNMRQQAFLLRLIMCKIFFSIFCAIRNAVQFRYLLEVI